MTRPASPPCAHRARSASRMTDEGGRARRDEVVRHERVTICAIAAGIVLTLPLPAAPQQTGKLVRIGCLSAASEAAAGHFFDAFRQRLRSYATSRGGTSCSNTDGRT